MHPRIQELLDHLDTHRAILRAAVDQIPPTLRDERPAPGRWSVAEVLEHLVIIEQRSTGILTTQLAAGRANGIGMEQETSAVLNTFDFSMLLDRSRTVEAPAFVQPRGVLDATAAWTALEQSRLAFREVIISGDGLALGTLVQPHLVLGPLTMYQWIALVGMHETRHAAQIREIGETLAALA